MRQELNFYQVRFRERPARFPASMLLQACASLVVAMLLLSTYASYQVTGVNHELEIIAQQETAAIERLENLRATIESVVGETSWAERLEQASRELSGKEASLRLISGTELGNAEGFARHLKSLARQATDGLWLTHIALSARGEQIWLQGEALRADLVPMYLQELADEAPFEQQRFHRLEIDRGEDDSSRTVTFVVTSDASITNGEVLYR